MTTDAPPSCNHISAFTPLTSCSHLFVRSQTSRRTHEGLAIFLRMEDGHQDTSQLENGASLDWEALRARSVQPHGFGSERSRLWPKLLYVNEADLRKQTQGPEESAVATYDEASGSQHPEEVTPHADERQIRLDTDRSFVLYPVDETGSREKLQAGLNHLIVSLFRRRPRLHYFQGYHDIVSVLFLTLPQELHLPVTEKISLHRVRDSMGKTLEPTVGLLRILKRILHLADEKFAATLEQAAPLPYYALSNLLTLFSHDIPTLPLIQHIFDYLLSRPPIAVVYLAAALTLTRREEVRILEDEGEEGMMHSLLTSLPDLYEEDDPAAPEAESSAPEDAPSSVEPKVEEAELHIPAAESATEAAHSPILGSETDDHKKIDTIEVTPSVPPAEDSAPVKPTPYSEPEVEETKSRISVTESTTEAANTPISGLGTGDHGDTSADATEDTPPSLPAKDSAPERTEPVPKAEPPEEADSAAVHEHTPSDEMKAEHKDAPPASGKPEPSPSEPTLSEKPPIQRTLSPEPLDPVRPHRPRISLSALLTHADALYAQYPPTHPSVALASVMGPQSVMLTWSEHRAELPSDDDAERMVLNPDLIVLPYIEPDDDVASEGDSYRAPGSGRKGGREKDREREKRRRKLRKPRRLTDMVVQRKTMVAGAVLVLGVAMAVYGFNAGMPGSGGGHHRSGFGREWRKVGRFLGGAIVGAGERVFEGIHHVLQ